MEGSFRQDALDKRLESSGECHLDLTQNVPDVCVNRYYLSERQIETGPAKPIYNGPIVHLLLDPSVVAAISRIEFERIPRLGW